MWKIVFFLSLFLSLVFPSTNGAPAQLGPRDGHQLPPQGLNRVKIGDKAPDFTLEDMNGKRISLSTFRRKKNVVLVFYRGHW